MELRQVLVGLSFLLIFPLANLFAQVDQNPKKTADEDEILEIDTQLVDVPLVVTDSNGNPLLNLKKENFAIFEDGKPQNIVSFSTTDAPFEVALLLDTSGSTRSELRLVKRSAGIFINSLRSGDRVAIVGFNTDYEKDRRTNLQTAFSVSEVVIGLTADRSKLNGALDNVQTSNGTPFYDGLVQVAEKVFRDPAAEKFRGRRALVALTDGVDSTSLADFEEARELLQAAGIVAYFIRIDTRENFEADLLGDCQAGVRFSESQIRRYYSLFENNARMEKVYDFCRIGDFARLDMSKSLYQLAEREMENLAKTSGGQVFTAASIRDARGAFQKVAADIGTNYSIGYYPSNDRRDGTFRRITVELKDLPKGAQVRAREGYTARKERD